VPTATLKLGGACPFALTPQPSVERQRTGGSTQLCGQVSDILTFDRAGVADTARVSATGCDQTHTHTTAENEPCFGTMGFPETERVLIKANAPERSLKVPAGGMLRPALRTCIINKQARV
jgi:hypothetical protein